MSDLSDLIDEWEGLLREARPHLSKTRFNALADRFETVADMVDGLTEEQLSQYTDDLADIVALLQHRDTTK